MSCQISLQLLLEVIRCGDRDRHPKAVKALSCDQTLACVVAQGIVGGRFGGLGANSPSAKWAIAIGHSVTGDSAVATNVFSLVKHYLPLLLRVASPFFKSLIFLIF
jgi:hypothetical protein